MRLTEHSIRNGGTIFGMSYLVVAGTHFYRLQRSWGKVIFSVACVKNSVQGGVPGQYPPEGTPPRQVHPLGRYTPARYIPPLPWQVHPLLEGTPPGQVQPPPAGTPPTPWQVHPSGRYPPWSMNGRKASYWNAFLLPFIDEMVLIFFEDSVLVNTYPLFYAGFARNYCGCFASIALLYNTLWCNSRCTFTALSRPSTLKQQLLLHAVWIQMIFPEEK